MSALLQMLISMAIFGTIGIFRTCIPLPSGFIAMIRGFVGAVFLLIVMFVRGRKPDLSGIRKNAGKLCLSGAFLGVNWILLFEAISQAGPSVATLCYYLAPIFIIIVSPFMLKERLTVKKIACVCVALLGMVFVSGILHGEMGAVHFKGVALGLAAAVFYACVVLTNKKIIGISANDRTVMQLIASTLVLLPYVLIAEKGAFALFAASNAKVILMLALLGVVHTGLAYALYFGSLKSIKAQTAAILSYIDPMLTLVLSALLGIDEIDAFGVIGAVLILGAAIASELPERKKGESLNP